MRRRITDLEASITKELASVLETHELEWIKYFGSFLGGKKRLGVHVQVTIPETDWQQLKDKRGNTQVVGEIFEAYYGNVKRTFAEQKPVMRGAGGGKGYEKFRTIIVVLA